MSLATSILLSSIILALAILFVGTKDKWNWSTISKRTGLSFLSLVIIGSLVGFGIYFFSKRPKIMKEYWGLTFNDTLEDVMFKKGKYREISDSESGSKNYTYVNEKAGYLILISSSPKKVIRVMCGAGACPPIQGINMGSTSAELIEKFGKPSEIKNLDESGLTRRYYFKRYNVQFDLEKDAVDGMSIYNY